MRVKRESEVRKYDLRIAGNGRFGLARVSSLTFAGGFGKQRERPDRAARRYFRRAEAGSQRAAEARRHGHILASIVGVGDRG